MELLAATPSWRDKKQICPFVRLVTPVPHFMAHAPTCSRRRWSPRTGGQPKPYKVAGRDAMEAMKFLPYLFYFHYFESS